MFMNDYERIIDNLDDAIAGMGASRRNLELVRQNMIDGVKSPGNHIATFDIDIMNATILSMISQEQLMRSLLVEYKARQD